MTASEITATPAYPNDLRKFNGNRSKDAIVTRTVKPE
jgi:hypothetical protein